MENLEFKDLQVSHTCTIIDAMKIMNEGASQIVLVVDEHLKLIGTLTDGDIRRGLITGIELESPINKVMKRDFKFVYSKEKEKASCILNQYDVTRVPVLDDNNQVVGLLAPSKHQENDGYENAIVIMAGGKGKRLWPYTKDCPKPMLTVDGKPILEILIEQCRDSGFRNFYLSVNYLKEIVTNYFGDGSRWDVNIKYLIEDMPLGTAGSLKMLSNEIDKPFLVMNGDVLTKIDLKNVLQFHNEHNSDATICVRNHQVSIPFGVVETDGVELSGFSEKPVYNYLVNAGIYILNPSILDLLTENHCTDMPDVLSQAKECRYSVCVFPIHEYWIDIGLPETMKEANKTWNNDDR